MLWIAISGAALVAPACYPRNCDGGMVTFGADPGQGRMVSPDLWESTGQSENWLWFPRQRAYVFVVPAWEGRTPWAVIPYVSAQERPQGSNYVIGAGNITLLSATEANRVNVTNDTCSDYYLRLAVTFAPQPDESDGGTPATPELDASSTDAAADDAGDAEAGP